MQDQLQILVVDDAAADRRAVRQALHARHSDAKIQEAASCAEAAHAVAARSFDCVFLDYHLPDGDGLGCLAEMREAGAAAPVILLTGRGDEPLAVEAIRAGAADYLPKSDLTPNLIDHCLRGALRYHQSQEQVRRAYAALELRDRAIAAASNGIVIADPHQPDCPIIYCNPAFSAMTGYPPEETIGRNCRFLQGPQTDAEGVRRLREALRAGRDCQVVLQNHRRDGTPWWNELSVSPVRDAAGDVTHFIGVQTDVTERVHAEEALRAGLARQQRMLRDMFASVTEGRLTLCGTPDDLPDLLPRFTDPIPLSQAGGIRELRRQTIGACQAVGIPDARRYDLETAVGEAAMNAVVHAAAGTGHVFAHDRGTVQVCVEDAGKGIAVEDLPNATLRRGYSSAGTMGHGFKMILKTVDRVHLLTGSDGTTVVIEQDQSPPPPPW